ncbi:histidine kinase [Metasolibacillus meyeri]|uniref:Histidine kinase n=1 Tax=Metasolibacillus meyeri TaxID=1071052 RepID=A0AAW9NQW7_9BACL|nr:ATP-binding protein [Metasolibacillus meyeri]MEC1178370.1 histidine kinase [Metasolibacillus meyeri]
MINKKLWWGVLTLCIGLGVYLSIVDYKSPLIKIKIQQQDKLWVVEKPYYEQWAVEHGIDIGDIILEIDNMDISGYRLISYDEFIRAANELTIKKQDGTILQVEVLHRDLLMQFYLHVMLPILYFVLSLGATLYLYYKRQQNIESIKWLILFILTVALTYLSSNASSKADLIGRAIISGGILLSPLMLLQFLKSYYRYLHIKWPFIHQIEKLYILPVIGAVLGCIEILYPYTKDVIVIFLLATSFILFLFPLWVLLYSYYKKRTVQLRLLILSVILPFLPFLFLFVLPEVFWQQAILEAEYSILFVLLIPFCFMFLRVSERLFDVHYYITRTSYYLLVTSALTIWLCVGLFFLMKNMPNGGVAVFLFISILLFFYVKEKVDAKYRDVLFTPKGNTIRQLSRAIDQMSAAYRVDELLSILKQEAANHLEIKNIEVVNYDGKEQEMLDEYVMTDEQIQQLQAGEIVRLSDVYVALIHQEAHMKRLLLIEHRGKIRLKDEELLWLKLLLKYAESAIESLKKIEELLRELRSLKQTAEQEPVWLKKLVWLKIEQEKYYVAQELHDTVLQNLTHLTREMSLLVEDDAVPIRGLYQQMQNNVQDLRTYCETLKPPVLDKLGLTAALSQLVQQVNSKAKFKLYTTFERVYLKHEQLPLVIYRIIQELLNNALKHSDATKVTLSLQELDEGFELIYEDDGIGCTLEQMLQTDSLGIRGIRERVEAFNGHCHIETNINEGVFIHIIIEGSEEDD